MTQSGLPERAERCCCFCVGLSCASGLTDGSRPVSTTPSKAGSPVGIGTTDGASCCLVIPWIRTNLHSRPYYVLHRCKSQGEITAFLGTKCRLKGHFTGYSTICLKTLPNAPKFVTMVLMICPPWTKNQRMRPAFLPGQICRTYFIRRLLQMKKRLISMALAVSMAVSIMPAPALATVGGVQLWEMMR